MNVSKDADSKVKWREWKKQLVFKLKCRFVVLRIVLGAKQHGIGVYFDVFIFLSVIFFVFEMPNLFLMLIESL